MSCDSSCVYFENKGNNSVCWGCADFEYTKPRFELGKVDIFKLARLLKEKEEKKGD